MPVAIVLPRVSRGVATRHAGVRAPRRDLAVGSGSRCKVTVRGSDAKSRGIGDCPATNHQTRQAFGLTIGWPALHEKAF